MLLFKLGYMISELDLNWSAIGTGRPKEKTCFVLLPNAKTKNK